MRQQTEQARLNRINEGKLSAVGALIDESGTVLMFWESCVSCLNFKKMPMHIFGQILRKG